MNQRVPSIGFRVASSADIALIASMHAISWAATYRGMLPDQYLDHEVHAERLAHWRTRMQQIEAEGSQVLIAEVDGIPAGFVCMVKPDAEHRIFIDNLHAMPAFQGLGLGSRMLGRAREWGRAFGAQGMYLYVLETNLRAIGFYESRGWRFEAREDDEMAGIEIVALRYVLKLG